MSLFKEGQQVVVIEEKQHVHFHIGDKLIVIKVDPNPHTQLAYLCVHSKTLIPQWVYNSQVEPLNQ